MQVFVIDPDPKICAMALDDLRINKMSIEAAQILSTAAFSNGHQHELMCKPTHKHHPLVIWAKDQANYNWLYSYYIELCHEFNRRRGYYGKIYDRRIALCLFTKETEDKCVFINCAENKSLGISFKHLPDVFTAYKTYLINRWKTDARKPKWTNTNPPDWYLQGES